MHRKSIDVDCLSKIGNVLSFRFIDLEYDYLVLEKKTGMSRAKIKRIFSGTQDMRISELIKICNALGLKTEIEIRESKE